MNENLSAKARRVIGIVEEINSYMHTISELEYQICDVPAHQRERDLADLEDEKKRLQDTENERINQLKDEQIEVEWDGPVIRVSDHDREWLQYYSAANGWTETVSPAEFWLKDWRT